MIDKHGRCRTNNDPLHSCFLSFHEFATLPARSPIEATLVRCSCQEIGGMYSGRVAHFKVLEIGGMTGSGHSVRSLKVEPCFQQSEA